MDTNLAKFQAIIEQHLGTVVEEFSLVTTFADLGLDSLDLIDLILTCEEAFPVEIPESEVNALRASSTLGTLFDAILRAQGITL